MLSMHEQFQQAFQALHHDGPRVPSWVEEIRQPALSDVKQLDYPTRKDEDWKYTSLRSLAEHPLEFSLAPSETPVVEVTDQLVDGDLALVFVDGVFSPTMSRLGSRGSGLFVTCLFQAMSTHDHLIQSALKDCAPEGKRSFSSLNRSMLFGGAFVYLTPGTKVDSPIQLLYLSSHKRPSRAIFPHNVICIGAGAQAQVIECHIGDGDATTFSNSETSVLLEEEASLRHSYLCANHQPSFLVSRTAVVQKRDSHFSSFLFSQDVRLGRHDVDVKLTESGAKAELDGLYLVGGTDHIDLRTSIDHQARDCESRQNYRGILSGKGRGVFNGAVTVAPGAHGTAAFQKNHNLMLSDEAEIDTKPQLEIEADDVKCSHGATVGQLSDDQLFYLASRGIPLPEAKKILCRGFAADLIDDQRCTGLRARLNSFLDGYLNHGL